MCVSVYHLLFTFIHAEFTTACLGSNANMKQISVPGFYHMILWCYKKLNSKTTLPGAFFFFFSWLPLVFQSVNCNAMHLLPLQCPLGWPPAARAPTCPILQPLCFQVRADGLLLPLKSEVHASHVLLLLFPPSHCLWGWARAGVCLGTGGAPAQETSVSAEPLCAAVIQYWQVIFSKATLTALVPSPAS